MGAGAVARRIDRGWRLGLAGMIGFLTLTAFGTGAARAATCDNSWKTGTSGSWGDPTNWSTGAVPTSGQNVCITAPGDYTVDFPGLEVNINSLTLGGPSSAPVLGMSGQPGNQASLTLAAGGSVASGATVDLSENCSTAGCVTNPASSLINDSTSTPLTNAGTLMIDAGSDGGISSRELAGNITNTGTIDVNAPLTYAVPAIQHAVGTLDNQGTFDLHNETVSLLVDPIDLTTPVVKNSAGGTITNDGGTGHILVQARGKFVQAGGTTSPAGVNPAHPAVLFGDTTFTDPLPTLSYTGGGASAVEVRGGATLTGNIASGQSLNINGSSGCPGEAQVTSPTGLGNAGTISLTGHCSSLKLSSGTLTNTGALVAGATGTNEISGGLLNSGTFKVNGATAFDKGGATLQQTGGSTTFSSSGATLDTSGSGSTFQLQGGALSGGGHSQGTAAVINGPVSNTGGDLTPGSASSPGIFSVNGYTQGSGGTLTAIIDGTSVGSGYSQLSSQGNASVGGTLAIKTLSGPTPGHLYTILGASNRSGEFSRLTGRFAPEGPFPPGWTAGYKADYEFPDAVAVDAAAAAGLRVKRAGPGSGTVTSAPPGINCGSSCDAPFFTTQTVTLTAHPGSGWAFGGWSGGCTGASRTCRVKMNRVRTVTATFAHRTTTKLSASRNPARKGRKVTFTAQVSPNPGGGTVRFTGRGGATISGCRAVAVSRSTGKATCSTAYHTTGSRTIKASYSGDASFAPSSSTLNERVTR